jgi:sphingosine kinase
LCNRRLLLERAAHAQELIKNMDIEQLKMFTAIVIVSGDGLIHEVFNGIMERRDWKVAIQTPVAAIPGGSGNALVTSLLHAAGEPVTPTCAVVALLHGQATPIDLATVQTRDKTYYSFLSLTWGLAADIDINSEKFRFLGNSRFAVSFLSKMVMYPKYRGRLHYLPVDSLSNESDMVASDDHRDKPLAHLLPPLTDSISEDQGWKFVTGEFVTVIGTMLSHLSEDLCIVPDAASNGGVIYLLVTGGDVSRMKVFKAFTGNLEVIKLLPVRAIRLEPEIGERARRSYMVLDGERIDYGAVQMQIHKGLGRVVALDHGKALSL